MTAPPEHVATRQRRRPALGVGAILTRPLGASFADWMGVSPARGGLDLGSGPVSLTLAALIVGFVIYLTLTLPRETATVAPVIVAVPARRPPVG